MRKSLTVLLVAGLVLTSCGWRDSRVNPGNWFGQGESVPDPEEASAANPLIPKNTSLIKARPDVDVSVPIENVSQLRIERTASGAIIHATGIASRQGVHGARLRPDNPDEEPQDGVLSYSFNVLYPSDPTRQGSEHTRRVEVARSLTNQQMEGVRTIRVTGATNARESRRQ